MKKTCKTCKYCVEAEDESPNEYYFCRRYPPNPSSSSLLIEGYWCGEYKEKDNE